MNLIDKYILREWGKAFLLVLTGIMGVLLLGLLYDDLMQFLNAGASFSEILLFYSVLIPSFLPMMVPIALLISLLFILGTLHRNNEVVAMRASGFSYAQITRTLWLSGIFLSIMLFILNAQWIPHLKETAKNLETQINYEKEARLHGEDNVGLIHNVAFDNTNQGRLWFINRFSDFNLKAYGISVYSRNPQGKEISRILAKEAHFINKSWVFYNGREINFDNNGDPIRSIAFKEKAFPQLSEDPKLMMTLSKKPRHLSLLQIKDILKTLDYHDNVGLAKYAVKYHTMLATPIGCLIAVGIAIPFALAGVRTNPLVGVSKAIALFFLYYLIMNITGILGSQLIIHPAIAAWIPNIILITIALFMYRRMVK